MKSELQHSSGAGRASLGSEMVLQALVYRSALQRSGDTFWAHRVQTVLPVVLVSFGISSSAPLVASWWINGACWGETGLFTWLEVWTRTWSVSRCYFKAFTVIDSICL